MAKAKRRSAKKLIPVSTIALTAAWQKPITLDVVQSQIRSVTSAADPSNGFNYLDRVAKKFPETTSDYLRKWRVKMAEIIAPYLRGPLSEGQHKEQSHLIVGLNLGCGPAIYGIDCDLRHSPSDIKRANTPELRRAREALQALIHLDGIENEEHPQRVLLSAVCFGQCLQRMRISAAHASGGKNSSILTDLERVDIRQWFAEIRPTTSSDNDAAIKTRKKFMDMHKPDRKPSVDTIKRAAGVRNTSVAKK